MKLFAADGSTTMWSNPVPTFAFEVRAPVTLTAIDSFSQT